MLKVTFLSYFEFVQTICTNFFHKQNFHSSGGNFTIPNYFLNLYFPFPWLNTGSIISACTKLESSFEAPEPFNSRSSITARLPNTSSKPNVSKSLWIWTVVFAEKSLPFSKSTLSFHNVWIIALFHDLLLVKKYRHWL